MRILTARHADVTALVYSADGGTLYGTGWGATGQDNDGLHVWHLGDDGRAEFPHTGQRVWWCWPLPDGRLLLGVRGKSLMEYTVARTDADGNPHHFPFRVNHASTTFAVSPTGDRLISVDRADPRAAIVCHRIDVDPIKEVWRQPFERYHAVGLGVEFDATGERFLSTDFTWDQVAPAGGHIARWRSAADGSLTGATIPLTVSTSRTQLLADGSRLVAMAGAALLSYDLANPKAKPNKATSGNRLHFTGVAVHPHRPRVFATCNDQSVREYDATTMKPIRAFDWKIGKLTCVAVAPDGATAATVGARRKVVVWDLDD